MRHRYSPLKIREKSTECKINSVHLLKTFVGSLAPADFDRQLNEPQYQPVPTVGVRLVSILSDNLQHAGQTAYLRGLWQGMGWRS